MSSALENIFSEENMLSYGGACLKLAEEVPHVQKRKGLDTLVIPSRGAVPFFLGMVHSLKDLSMYSEDHQNFVDNLGVQSMLAPLLPEDSVVARTARNKKIRVLLAPFTADLNVEKFDPTQDNTQYTSMTREYWANVTAAMFKGAHERAKDPYFRSFTDVILKHVERRDEIADKYVRFPTVERFAMIDTVISGRASNEILKVFERLAKERGNPNLNPYSFLIIDENGRKLVPDFKRYLEDKYNWGNAQLMRIPRIVSEDEGASLLGVSAVMYPSIMKSSRALRVGDDNRVFFVGAGSWRLGDDLHKADRKDKADFERFMDLVYSAIDANFAKEYSGIADSDELARFRAERQSFLEYAEKHRVFMGHRADATPLKLNQSLIYHSVYETSSHVVHVPFEPKSNTEVLAELVSLPGVKIA